MIDRKPAPQTALILSPQHPGTDANRAQARLEEAIGLAQALDLITAEARIEPLRRVEAGGFFGSGKIEQIAERVGELEVTVVIVDAALSPIQQRNLEKKLNAKVIDRTGLILEIFGLRAQTREGRLQVELARLAYERSRLVRTWTHLERQRGGRGFLAGPGETQIETDRRLLADKMAKLRRELDEVKRTRKLHRKKRLAAPWPTVALVGYTNAGKSTLFNLLSNAQVLAKDMPFATLDPTVRGVKLPSGRRVLMSDTVGFITDLPTELIAAFRATLEEVIEADVLIHVRDMADPDHEGRKADVEQVLAALGAGAEADQHVIEAWNKADQLLADDCEELVWRAKLPKSQDAPVCIVTSAVTGQGIDALLDQVELALSADDVALQLEFGPADAEALAFVHRHGAILSEQTDATTGRVSVHARLSVADAGRLRQRYGALNGLEAPAE
ncbi:GTPase HflX [Oceanicaulis alexandrii]|uniref:GTPase HflX n=1 Tax=Oceanicaulis alexandrii TaxID=153233 RepID=UPI0035CF1788